ncbi:MAG: SDR family oxidoreductase [Lentilitoribacter sp.]
MRLMIFGAGFSGRAIGKKLSETFDFVGGTTRSEEKFELLSNHAITPFTFSGDAFSPDLAEELASITHLIQSISPDKTGDPIIPLVGENLRAVMPNLQWVGYLSTVGVYGNHDGAWVDEATVCKPVSKRSVARVEAENLWQELCEQTDIPLAILRLSGIYGPGRNTFENYKKGTARRLIKKDQVFNRIFVDDIAGASELLMREHTSGIFNVTDNQPAPPQDVVAYAAELLGIEPPEEIDFETAELSPMARSFYGENKRVSNAKIKKLGYEFKQPDYRAALDYLKAEFYPHGI